MTAKIGGLWVATHKPRGHWVRAGLKNGDLFVAHFIVLSAPTGYLHCELNSHRLITAYLFLQANCDKIMHAC